MGFVQTFRLLQVRDKASRYRLFPHVRPFSELPISLQPAYPDEFLTVHVTCAAATVARCRSLPQFLQQCCQRCRHGSQCMPATASALLNTFFQLETATTDGEVTQSLPRCLGASATIAFTTAKTRAGDSGRSDNEPEVLATHSYTSAKRPGRNPVTCLSSCQIEMVEPTTTSSAGCLESSTSRHRLVTALKCLVGQISGSLARAGNPSAFSGDVGQRRENCAASSLPVHI